jgi:biotin operon repressor
MLFRTKDLEAIFAGQCTLAFRRWKRPTVKPGGTVRTQHGLVGIDSVEAIEPQDVTEAEARAAGYKDRAGVIAMFDAQEGICYRIRLHPAGPDPRDALSEAEPDTAELQTLAARLQKLDKAAGAAWTKQALQLIAAHPGVVSTTLAESAGMERADFKLNIRKLKALGLTISLEVGYRLSPRGVALLATL